MQADNFSLRGLAGLADMAHSENRRIYVAMNTILKPGELEFAGSQLKFWPKCAPRRLIVQDLGAVDLARQAGYEGQIHLSTLANVTHQGALKTAWEMGASRVILPRELSIDEIKSLSDACPEGLELELFVHGALCYCVSGRCYWSSYMGGKSSLRGQCVQPCRRVYKQGSKESAFFSCLDLSLDVLVKTLLPVEKLVSWKLEGGGKGRTMFTM
jgi:Collagenase and related proteases